MGIFNEFYKKEKPVFTGITRGVGGFGFGAAAGGGGGGLPAPGVVASGGTKVPYLDSPDGRTYHIFTTNDNFTVTSTGGEDIEVLLIGGGGGGNSGGDSAGGGGGAGGLVYRHSVPISAQAYPMVIGPGGSGAANGGDTTGFSLTALGGGQGVGRAESATSGGNGGGGSGYSGVPDAAEGSGTQPSQNPGVPNLTQYGHPGYSPGDNSATYYQFSTGGSGNANNDRTVNATFPNGSTIISDAPPAISTKNLSRGGYYSPPGAATPWAADDYGSGGRGTPGSNTGGKQGVVVVRYGIAP